LQKRHHLFFTNRESVEMPDTLTILLIFDNKDDFAIN